MNARRSLARGAATKRFRILVVDDDPRILNFLRSKLKASGYDALTATDGQEGLEMVHAQEPDLVILDLLMPRMGGLDMLKELRTFSALPVIILTAKGEDAERIQGLRLGADDYLPKPFNPDELVARIEAVRRRVRPDSHTEPLLVFAAADVTMDFRRRRVEAHGEEKYLTRIEWLLLSELAHNAGRLMLYEDLLTRVWGPEYRDDVQLLRTWISRLRAKLEANPNEPRLIRTIPKAGYLIDQPSS